MLLRDLSARVDEDDQEMIRIALEEVGVIVSVNRTVAHLSPRLETTLFLIREPCP